MHAHVSIRNDSNLRIILASIEGLQPLKLGKPLQVSNHCFTYSTCRAKNTSLETIESWANYKNHSEEWSGELWSGRAEDIHYDRLGLKHCKLWGLHSSSWTLYDFFEVFEDFMLSRHLFLGSWVSCPTHVNMCRTYSSSLSSSSLEPSSHVPSSRASSSRPFSQPRQVNHLWAHCQSIHSGP